jgi:hypothetical protein
MEAVLSYCGASGLEQDVLRLAPNLRRDPTRLHARIADPLAFRDALLALHDVVRSELYVSQEDIVRRLDPLITVTPEGVFFEAFSLDESSYGRVALRPGALEGLRDTSYGCTNVDFSPTLVSGLRQIRSGQETRLEVAREGIVVEHGARHDREEKIDLPDSWMRGFLEVQAALGLPSQTLRLAPIDLGNVLAYLKGRKEKESPRGLVFELGPEPRVTVQPWDRTFPLRKSTYEGPPATVKVWGRRRLLLLDKVLGRAREIRVRLLGTGGPSFWTCDLGSLSFLLGMSAWSAREWTRSDCFRLFEPPVADEKMLARTLAALEERMVLAGGDRAALNQLCLRGRALYDPDTDRWFARRVFTEDPPDPAPTSEREREAEQIVSRGQVKSIAAEGNRHEAMVKGRYRVVCEVDRDGRLTAGRCDCAFYARMSLQRGPCKHLIALHRKVTRAAA